MCQSKAEGGRRCFTHASARYNKCLAEADAADSALRKAKRTKAPLEEQQAAANRSLTAFYNLREAQTALAASGERGYLTLILQCEELVVESYRTKSMTPKWHHLIARSNDLGSLAEKAFYGRDINQHHDAAKDKFARHPYHDIERTRTWNDDGSATFTVDGQTMTLSNADYWDEYSKVNTNLYEQAVTGRQQRIAWIRARLSELESGVRGDKQTIEWLPQAYDRSPNFGSIATEPAP